RTPAPRLLDRDPPPSALHSFPTRRSSDLQRSWVPARTSNSTVAGPRAWSSRTAAQLQRIRPKASSNRSTCSSVCTAETVNTRHRSEEHTSELQSPYDLVCRLLLEKKKKSP